MLNGKSPLSKFDISVVLCHAVGREAERIRISVESLNTQDIAKDRVQLCFVNHGAQHSSIPMVSRISRYPVAARWVPNKDGGYNACFGRNAAIPLIKGKLVFFMHDAVHLGGENYLSRLWEYSRHGECGVATTKQVSNGAFVGCGSGTTGWFAHQDAIPAKYFKELKFFEGYDGAHGYDDLDLFERAKLAGCEFVTARDLTSEKLKPVDPVWIKYTTPEYGNKNNALLHERMSRSFK